MKDYFIELFELSEEELDPVNWIEPLIAVTYLFGLVIGFFWFVGSL